MVVVYAVGDAHIIYTCIVCSMYSIREKMITTIVRLSIRVPHFKRRAGQILGHVIRIIRRRLSIVPRVEDDHGKEPNNPLSSRLW